MHIFPHVPLGGQMGLAGVHTHAEPDRPRRKRHVRGFGRCDCPPRVSEDVKERVTLCIHLNASQPSESRPHKPSMFGQRSGVALRT